MSIKKEEGYMVYEIENISKARIFLSSIDIKIVISNPEGSTRYYGMYVIDYIFTSLLHEFPEKIDGVLVKVFDDYQAFNIAKELGYNNIESL